MKLLKFTSPGYENYTGPIGEFEFVDGVSTEVIGRAARDRLSTAFSFVEIDGDGVETPAGVAHRLVADREIRAADQGALDRQTETEKTADEIAETIKANKPPVEQFYTRPQLVELADKEGIKGLRSHVGDPWGVSARNIVVLIEKILEKQNDFLSARNKKLDAKAELERAAAATKLSGTAPVATLVGSDLLESTYEIDGVNFSLGDIVRLGFEAHGGTLAEWNALDQSVRDSILVAIVDDLQDTAEIDEEVEDVTNIAEDADAAAALIAAIAQAAEEEAE